MTPEEKKLLEETHALAKDNHRLLRSVRFHQIITDFGKFILWIVLIALAGYYYIFSLQPLVEKYQLTLPTSADVQKLIDSYKAGQ